VPEALLEVSGLYLDYITDVGDAHALQDVSFELAVGEFLGIVGESGCGKSTLLFAIAQLLSPNAEITGGTILFRGQDMVRMGPAELRHIRWRDYSMVMQSAMNALNPMKSIGAQFKDAMEAHSRGSSEEIRKRSAEVLEMVGIDPVHLDSFPHQLSGGMRQRTMIAMALLFTPQLVIMDEPTSALDVVAQRSLMTKIRDLQKRLGFAVIFVTHDMSLVGRYSDRVMVMYAGQLVEEASTHRIFDRPCHPYTRLLMRASPSVHGPRQHLTGIPGAPPDLVRPPGGCLFHPRCPEVFDDCHTLPPALYAVGNSQARCLFYDGKGRDELLAAHEARWDALLAADEARG
jgi:peptide/nickel transport system ATP-binding protein